MDTTGGTTSAAPQGPKRLSLPAIALIASNLVPLWGVLFAGWQIFPVVFLFWCENVIVGLFNILRILASAPRGAAAMVGKFFVAGFFAVHYGLFCFVHGVFVIAFFSGAFVPVGGGPATSSFNSDFPNPLEPMFEYGLFSTLGIAILALIISHGISFFVNYLGRKEYLRMTPQRAMGMPYGRVVILHVVILFGGFAVAALGSPVPALILLIVLKVGMDLGAHIWEHNRLALGGDFGEDDADSSGPVPAEELLRQYLEKDRTRTAPAARRSSAGGDES